MSILSFFDDFSFATHYPYILMLIGIIAALVIVIIFVRKHIALTVVIVIFGGLLVGYYFGNLYFALGFSENMTCAALRKDESEYEKYELGNVYIYQYKNIENDKIVDNSDDIFAVRKFWFVYVKANPTAEYEAVPQSIIPYSNIDVKEYKTSSGYIYQLVPQGITALAGTTTKNYLTQIQVKDSEGKYKTLDSKQLYLFESDERITEFKALGITFKFELKESK